MFLTLTGGLCSWLSEFPRWQRRVVRECAEAFSGGCGDANRIADAVRDGTFDYCMRHRHFMCPFYGRQTARFRCCVSGIRCSSEEFEIGRKQKDQISNSRAGLRPSLVGWEIAKHRIAGIAKSQKHRIASEGAEDSVSEFRHQRYQRSNRRGMTRKTQTHYSNTNRKPM